MKTAHHSLFSSLAGWLQTDLANNILVLLVVALIVAAVVAMWRSSVWGEPLHRLVRNKLAMACLFVLVLYGVVAILQSVQWASGRDQPSHTVLERMFTNFHYERSYSAPLAVTDIDTRHPHKLSHWHLLGTDALGQDVLLQTLKGCRTAWIVGGFTLVLAIPIAILLGIAAGYFGGIVDDIVQYVYITLSSIPSILLLVTLMMVLGQGLLQMCIALAVTEWVGLARYLRGETLKHREKEYVLAAKAMGVHPLRIIFRHILPNVFHLVIISATLSFSGLIQYEAILDYLGIGVPQGTGSWGLMIDAARMELTRDPIIWWNLTAAAMALFGLVLVANLFGDAVRDAFDPRLREG